MKKTIHIISCTHWDREFRWNFETTRTWLVKLWDNLLETMAQKPDYRHFLMDGQFGLVEDYLEIRPEKEAQIRQLTQEGRLLLGPWYTLPDSSSIHGESLIRNLMTGLKKADDYGGAMRVGYNVFSFGQIAQLPQIYAGFGINFIFFYKHMNRSRSRFDEFIWQAPDGTQALASRLGTEARWNFFFGGHIPIVYNIDPWHRDWQYRLGDLGKIFHLCEANNYADFHFITEPETSFHAEQVKNGFERTLATLRGTAVGEHLLFWEGTDFTEHHPLTPEIIAEAQKIFGEEYEIIHSSLPEYVNAVKPLLKKRDIDTVTGEMKDGPVGAIHTDVCSVHPDLKRRNGLAENKLFRLAEPLATAAWLQGARYPHTYIAKALDYLFHSQAHDSLHGVGPGSMCDDIRNRMQHADVISENVAIEAMQNLAAGINTADAKDADIFLTVFNGCAFPRTEIAEAYIDVPRDVFVDNLAVEDTDGNAMPIHVIANNADRAGIYHPRSRNMPFYITRYRVLFEARDIPAVGYKTFKVKWTEKSQYPYPTDDWDPLKVPFSTLCGGNPRGAENEFVILNIAPDGTLAITDKTTGKTYRDLNYFIDSGEDGNLYFHRPPATDRIITTQGSPANIACVLDSPLMAKFVVETTMLLPDYLDKGAQTRSQYETMVLIRSEITLRKGTPVVEVISTVDNKVKDHFLRIGFATGLQAEKTAAGGVFDVNTYATAPTRDGQYRGQELARRQQHMFMDISDGRHGLAVLNDSLRDYEVLDAARGTIAQSFVRGVPLRIPVDNRKWMEYPGDESGQSLGKHTSRYALLPHAGEWQTAEILKEAQAFGSPLRVAQIGRQPGCLTYANSALEVKGANLVLSAFKKAEDRDSAIVRIYNPSDAAVDGKLLSGRALNAAYRVNLNEERQETLSIDGAGGITLTIPPKKIVTIELEPRS